ncbi:fibronectin type III domain-containing protein, partial [Geobacter sp. SVR]
MITLTPYIKSFMVDFAPAQDLDLAGYRTHVAHESELVNGDFTPTANNLVNHGPDTNFVVKVDRGGAWFVKIGAYDTFGEEVLNYSALHSVVVATTDPLDVVPPETPVLDTSKTVSDLEGTGVFQTAYILLAWTLIPVPNDFSNYLIRQKKHTESSWTEIQLDQSPTYKASNLIPGVSYDFQICAVDQWINASSWSDTYTVTAHADTVAPVVPTSPSVVTAMRTVFIKWDANVEADLDEYVVEVAENPTFTLNKQTFHTANNSLTFNGSQGVTYYIRVSAVDYSGNNSGPSATVSAMPGLVVSADIDTNALEASNRFTNVPVIKEASYSVWRANTPAGGISWNSHHAYYQGKQFTVNAGSTTQPYVQGTFAGADGSTISYTGVPDQTAKNDTTATFIMAKNTNGNLEVIWNSEANMVIGSAYIMDGAITNAKITSLTADKIKAGTLDCGLLTIENLNFSDIGGSISWGDGTITNKPSKLSDLDSAASTKLSGIADGATKGADWATNVSGKPMSLSELNSTDGTTLSNASSNASSAVNQLNTLTTNGGKLTYIDSQGAYLGTLNASKITAGTFAGGGIGFSTGATVNLDGNAARITVNDGTRDRIYIGKLGTGDYGIDIKDALGSSVVKVSNGSGAILQNATVGNLVVSGQGILCGSGNSAFKVWDAGSGSVNMYLGDYLGSKTNYLYWNGSKLEIAAKVVMSSDSLIQWSNLSPETQTNLRGPQGIQGLPGATGATGATGPKGDPGVTPDMSAYMDKGSFMTTIGADYVFTQKIACDKLVGNVITGKTFQTADSGQRFVVDYTTNDAKFYDSSGTKRVKIGVTTGTGEHGSSSAYLDMYMPTDATGISCVGMTYSDTAMAYFQNGGFSIGGWICYGPGISALGTYGVYGYGVSAGIYGTGYYGVLGTNKGRGESPKSTAAGQIGVRSEVSGTGAVAYKAVASNGASAVYSTFTGAHEMLIPNTETAIIGDIVSDTAILFKESVSDAFGTVEVTSRSKDKTVLGVLACEPFDLDKVPEDWKAWEGIEELLKAHKVIFVNAVGEGQINVCKDGGNIYAGDLICSSTRPGKGMRQEDDLLFSYTVAKAREDCIWEEGEDDIRMIACIYHCG